MLDVIVLDSKLEVEIANRSSMILNVALTETLSDTEEDEEDSMLEVGSISDEVALDPRLEVLKLADEVSVIKLLSDVVEEGEEEDSEMDTLDTEDVRTEEISTVLDVKLTELVFEIEDEVEARDS